MRPDLIETKTLDTYYIGNLPVAGVPRPLAEFQPCAAQTEARAAALPRPAGGWTLSDRSFRALVVSLYVLAALTLVYLAVSGASYYLTPLIARPRHPSHWSLKPGAPVGHGLGIVGSTMMLLLLLYSVRKRWPRLRGFGRLSRWLDIHIWLGIVGPLLVVLHSSFKVGGLVALSFWSMIAVASSGVVGRYLYVQIPRTRSGREMDLRQVEAQEAALTERLRTGFSVGQDTLARIDAATFVSAAGGTLRALGAGMVHGMTLRYRIHDALRRAGVPGDVRRRAGRILCERARLRRRITLLDRTQRLFHYWHVVHKPFAAVMYLFMIVHIVVALATGYGWGSGWR